MTTGTQDSRILAEFGTECENMFRRRQSLTPDQCLFFDILEDALDHYLFGVLYDGEIDSEVVCLDRDMHEEGKSFIFGDQDISPSFDFCWEAIYPGISPDVARVTLLMTCNRLVGEWLRRKATIDEETRKEIMGWACNTEVDNGPGVGRTSSPDTSGRFYTDDDTDKKIEAFLFADGDTDLDF